MKERTYFAFGSFNDYHFIFPSDSYSFFYNVKFIMIILDCMH